MRFPVSSNFPLSITIPSVLSINFIIPGFPRFPALEQREADLCKPFSKEA
jgi:hypothetical protein